MPQSPRALKLNKEAALKLERQLESKLERQERAVENTQEVLEAVRAMIADQPS